MIRPLVHVVVTTIAKDGLQMGRLLGSGQDLNGRRVADADHPNLPVPPTLPGDPLHKVIAVFALPIASRTDKAAAFSLGLACPSSVHNYVRVSPRHNVLCIAGLDGPVPERARTGLGGKCQPHFLQLFTVLTVGKQRWKPTPVVGAKNIRGKPYPVPHGDANVLLHFDPVDRPGAFTHLLRIPHSTSW